MKDQLARRVIEETIEKKTKALTRCKKQNNLPSVELGTEDIAEINRAAMLLLPWLTRDIPKTDEEFIARTNEYFVHQFENGLLPTWESYCLALGTTNETVFNWMNTGSKGLVVSNLCKNVKQLMASNDAQLAATGKIQPVVYIFRSKNYYGMKDQADVVISTNNGIEHKTEAELREKYKDYIEVDADVE